MLPDERGSTVSAFLWRALAWYRRQGIRVRRVMTDNAFAYLGHSFTALCAGARPAAPANSALHAADEWQGGAFHPNVAARVSLRAPVWILPRAPRRHAALAALL